MLIGHLLRILILLEMHVGQRGETFGEDKFLVSEMGVAVINGLQQGDFQLILVCLLQPSTLWQVVIP